MKSSNYQQADSFLKANSYKSVCVTHTAGTFSHHTPGNISITSSASQFIIPLTYAVVILSIVIQGLSFKRVSTKLFPN